MRGRPLGSQIRQNIIEILYFMKGKKRDQKKDQERDQKKDLKKQECYIQT